MLAETGLALGSEAKAAALRATKQGPTIEPQPQADTGALNRPERSFARRTAQSGFNGAREPSVQWTFREHQRHGLLILTTSQGASMPFPPRYPLSESVDPRRRAPSRASARAVKSLSFGVGGVKKQGVSGHKNGRLFSSVSAVRFERTVKLAAPQNRSGLCSKRGTAANRALPTGTTPPSGSRGNDELRTPGAIPSARLVEGCRSPFDTSASGKAARDAPKLVPGTVRGSRLSKAPG
jgi:hypothetical protein